MFLLVALTSVMMLEVSACAQGEKVPRRQLKALVNEYKSRGEFEGMNFGKMALSLFRKAASVDAGDDESVAAALKVMKSVTGLTVADYEDCSPEVRRSFNRKLSRIMDGVELLMSAKDEGETVLVYGYVSNGGNMVEDVVISMPDEGTLVCLFGRIDMSLVGELVETAK